MKRRTRIGLLCLVLTPAVLVGAVRWPAAGDVAADDPLLLAFIAPDDANPPPCPAAGLAPSWYWWERCGIADGDLLSVVEAEALLADVSAAHGVAPPALNTPEGVDEMALACGLGTGGCASLEAVAIPRDNLTERVVLHELAHAVHSGSQPWEGREPHGHGLGFRCLALRMYTDAGLVPDEAVYRAMARECQ